jgi:hypothetical protein
MTELNLCTLHVEVARKCPVGTWKAGPLVLSPKDTQFRRSTTISRSLAALAQAIWDQHPE